MEIKKEQNGSALTIKVIGRLDAGSAPELSKELTTALDGVTDLTFDFAELKYIASAGLRVLLKAQKKVSENGTMRVINAVPEVMRIFETTGFTDILNIEK